MRPIRSSLLTTIALSASAFAASCSTLGTGASDSFTGSFTFSIKTVSTGTSVPGHLVQFLTIPGQSFQALSSGTSPSVVFGNMQMSGGGITAQAVSGPFSPSSALGPVKLDSTDFPGPGPFLMWANTFSPPTGIFCAVPQTDGSTILALNGHTDMFVLCQADMSSTATNIRAVVYNATLSAYETGPETYNGNTCVPVDLVFTPV
ncbi:hypothetical protein PsYK624_056710 [Phanerochaete sordida]|uniref:Uncharacterized protein n=1 Tax=Phanerochaete sordida TaxID=48140 RepID=A0A9P3G5G9_9APHY|nr:hypothetical protein PsYK624_056710 [Phanerochaete sordida]